MENAVIFSVAEHQIETVKNLFPEDVIEALRRHLPVTALMAVWDDRAVGGLSGVIFGNEFLIGSVYVAPSYRGRGVGSALIRHLYLLLAKAGMDIAIRADLTVLNREEAGLIPFFRSLGFYEDTPAFPCYYSSRVGSVTDELNRDFHVSHKIRCFLEMDLDTLLEEEKRCRRAGAPMPKDGFSLNVKSERISFCVWDGKHIHAFLVIEPLDKELLRISALWSELKDPRPTMLMIKKAAEAVQNDYAPDTRITALVLNPESESILRHLFPDLVSCSHSYVNVIPAVLSSY